MSLLCRNRPVAIARWTIAPELNGALELGDQLNRLGVLVSVGHSNAVYAQVKEAAEHGFRHVTHLYSAMSTITRKNGFRYAGVLESTFCLPQLTAEIIADGCHLPPELVRMVYTLLGVERVCFCCDSMRCAGEQVTRSFLGNPQSGIPVIIEDGVAKLVRPQRVCGLGRNGRQAGTDGSGAGGNPADRCSAHDELDTGANHARGRKEGEYCAGQECRFCCAG